MRKKVLICIVILITMLSFLLGWRWMPSVWPEVKDNVIYPILPQLRPSPTPILAAYVPVSDTAFGNPILTSDSLVYYFYKDYCIYCQDISPLMEGLPKQICLPDGTVSRVRLISLNKTEGKSFQIIDEYYKDHNVPQERQYVPAVVIGEYYLFLRNEIVDQLMDALSQGAGLETPLLDGAERIE